MNQLFHYTSRQGAQDISASRSLQPGPSERICLTPDKYEFGWQAAACLSMDDQALEYRCLVDVSSIALEDPRPTQPLYSPDGTLLRPGGGLAYYIAGDMAIELQTLPQWEPLQGP